MGLFLGLYALKYEMRDKQRLPADAIHVEQDVIGEAVGSQDQVSAAYGGFNRINFHTDGAFEVHRVIASPDSLEACRITWRSSLPDFRAPRRDRQGADEDDAPQEERT